ncbi:hypothetical protein D3C73_1533350 [compost metagenome]
MYTYMILRVSRAPKRSFPCPAAGRHERRRGNYPFLKQLLDRQVFGMAHPEIIGIDNQQLGIGFVAQSLSQCHRNSSVRQDSALLYHM